MNEPQSRLAPDNVRLIVDTWCSKHTLDSFPWVVDPDKVEVPVVATLHELPKDFCLCSHDWGAHARKAPHQCDDCPCNAYQTTIEFLGKLDLMGRLRRDPSVYCVIDSKTTWRIDQAFVRQYLLDSQITGYIWLAAQACKRPAPTIKGFINALEIALVPSDAKKCRTHGLPYEECGPEHIRFQVVGPIDRTADQIEQWRTDAVTKALAYRRALHKQSQADAFITTPMEGTFNSSCRYCEFFEWCCADRPTSQLNTMFTERPWNPRAHVFGPNCTEPDPLVFTVDNSTLKAAYSCTTQAVMRYGWGYTSADQLGPLRTGTLVHTALEAFFKTGRPQAALTAFDHAIQTED